jgi:hypothetical protein
MIPNHILNEVTRRLASAEDTQAATIANALGIDLEAAREPRLSDNVAAPALLLPAPSTAVVHAAVPFEITLTVLGHEVTQTCRAVFAATLADDVDRRTGQPIRILGQVELDWQTLDWRDLDRVDEVTGEHPPLPAPVWTDDFEGLLPTEVPSLILDLVEQQARALEAAGQSNS